MKKNLKALKNIFHRDKSKLKDNNEVKLSDNLSKPENDVKKNGSALSGIYNKNKDFLSKLFNYNKTSNVSNLTEIYLRNKEYDDEVDNSEKDSIAQTSSFLQKVPSLDQIPFNNETEINSNTSNDEITNLEDSSNGSGFTNIFSTSSLVDDNLNINEESTDSPNKTKKDYMKMSISELINYNYCKIDESASDEDYYHNLNLSDFPKPKNLKEYNREHWLVSKLVKYLKTGNATATYIALAILRDLDLDRDSIIYSLVESSAILVLVNLLETNDIKCQCGSMQILKELSKNKRMAFEIIKEGGIIALIKILNLLDNDAKCLSAECLANLSMLNLARSMIRKHDGIRMLIKILGFFSVNNKQTNNSRALKRGQKNIEKNSNLKVTNNDSTKQYELMKSVSLALYALSKDEINHYIMLKHGIIIILKNIIKIISNEKAIYWLVALLDNCSATEAYVVAIISEDLIRPLVKRLRETSDYSLKTYILGIFSKCAQDSVFCDILKNTNCFSLIFKLADEALQKVPLTSITSGVIPSAIKGRSEGPNSIIKQVAYSGDNNEKPSEKLIRNITGTLAKCCLYSPFILEFLTKSKIIEKLVSILNYYESQYDSKSYYNENTIINITKAISVCMYNTENGKRLFNLNATKVFINLLKINNDEIIVNTCHILGLCSLETEFLSSIHELDGIRLIWSLLRNKNDHVQESACWLLYVCIARIKNFGELVRNLTGGIELLLSLLDNDQHSNVLAYACATISKVAIDVNNLAIMSDYKIVEKLTRLCLKYYNTPEKEEVLILKMFLADAVAQCSLKVENSLKFGDNGVISLLVKYLALNLEAKNSENISIKAKPKNIFKKLTTDLLYCPCENMKKLIISDTEIQKSLIKALKGLSNNPLNCFRMYREKEIVNYLIESISSIDHEIQENSVICLKNIRNSLKYHRN